MVLEGFSIGFGRFLKGLKGPQGRKEGRKSPGLEREPVSTGEDAPEADEWELAVERRHKSKGRTRGSERSRQRAEPASTCHQDHKPSSATRGGSAREGSVGPPQETILWHKSCTSCGNQISQGSNRAKDGEHNKVQKGTKNTEQIKHRSKGGRIRNHRGRRRIKPTSSHNTKPPPAPGQNSRPHTPQTRQAN